MSKKRPGPARPPFAAPPPPQPKPRPARATAVAPVPWSTHLAALLTVSALALALYWPCLNGPFVYDDPNAVTQSQLIRRLWPLSGFLSLSTRPLTDYSYAIDYAISALRPRSYHVTNLLLHIVNGLLLYGLALRTLARPGLAARYGEARPLIAWAAAALFVSHPLASETVAYISSRSEILASSFYLLALTSFVVAATTPRPTVRRAHAVLLPLWTAAGLGSKEIAVTAPAAMLLYDWLFLAGADWRRTRRQWSLIGLALLPLAAGGLFLVLRAYRATRSLGEYAATAGLGFDRFTGAEYLMTQFGVILHYLRLLVLPFGQTFDYDWPLARSPLALGVLLPLAALAVLTWLVWRARRAQPLAAFAWFWMLLILAPTSSVLPIADLAVERRMYLPLAGLALLAAAWLYDLAARVAAALQTRPGWTYAACALAPVLALAPVTHARAVLWGDAIALHEDGVAKALDNPRVRLNLGVTYLNLQQRDKALDVLKEAKRIFDRGESVHCFPRIGAFIHYNLGAVLFTHKEYDRAAVELQRSLELGGQYLALRPMAHMLLGRIAAQRGDWKAGAVNLQEALRYQEVADWRFDLLEMQMNANDPQAPTTLMEIGRRYPNHPRLTPEQRAIFQRKAVPAR